MNVRRSASVIVPLLTAAAVLSACATGMGKDECVNADWRTIGPPDAHDHEPSDVTEYNTEPLLCMPVITYRTTMQPAFVVSGTISISDHARGVASVVVIVSATTS